MINQRVLDNRCSVGVVIPTYNRDDLLKDCLECLKRQTLPPSRIIITDNGSRNKMPEFLRRFKNLEWIPLLSNQGTAVAFNRGIAATNGCDYIFLLNNDAEMEPECLSHLVQALESDNRYSAAVPKLLRWSDARYLDGVGDEILRGGGAYRVGHGELDAGQYEMCQPVFSACAAAALYRTTLFKDIGGFDEDFFAYREDVDLGLRAQLRGHRCLYVPTARVRHHGSATMGRPAHSWIVRLSTRNQILAILKSYPASTLFRSMPQLVFFQILWCVFAFYRNAGWAYCLGVAEALRALPRTLAKRMTIQSGKRLNGHSFLKLLEDSERRIWQSQTNGYNPQSSRLLGIYFWLFRPHARAAATCKNGE
jgi:GT2 family glycosyltransferase